MFKLTNLFSGANIAGAAAVAKKTTTEVAREVISGEWGSGKKRTEALKKAGYNPTEIQNEVNRLLCCRELIIQNMKAWASKIISGGKYKYVPYSELYGHECAVCYPHDGKNHGWQCIGFAIATWHHSGLPIPCNCGVINNTNWEAILNAKSDAEALKIAKSCLKINDIKVIRNKNGIPKNQAQPGDLAALFVNNNKYQHTYVIMPNDKVADSTQAGGYGKDINFRNFSGRYVDGMKVIIRYTGNGFVTPAKKTIDELAYEVIDGKWGSGDSRKRALTECKYDYNAVQKRVNEILNPPKPSGKKYDGPIPTLRLKKTNAEVIADTIKWAKWIASDNRFHYGYTNKTVTPWKPNAHHNGCYFCKTQPKSKKGIVDYQFTYCCNPFVGAAWAHGGCIPTALNKCQHCNSWDFNPGQGYDASKLFDKLGKPKVSELKPGDVLCSDGHVALYIGNGKVVQAANGDDNVKNSPKWNKSISVGTWGGWKRAYRFNSSVDADILMCHGEVSKRVAEWQAFLDWWFDGKVGKADGYFGDNTLKWTKKFQEEVIGKGQGDGICGSKTFAAAAKAEKK